MPQCIRRKPSGTMTDSTAKGKTNAKLKCSEKATSPLSVKLKCNEKGTSPLNITGGINTDGTRDEKSVRFAEILDRGSTDVDFYIDLSHSTKLIQQ